MDVSSPTLWMCIDICSSVRAEFQMTEFHQSELTVQDSQTLPRAQPRCAWLELLYQGWCTAPVLHWVCALCLTHRPTNKMGENAGISGGVRSKLGKVMLKCIWLEHS